MTPRAEELWSYLTGLAPVGTPIKVDLAQTTVDIGIRSRPRLSQLCAELIASGAIKRIEIGVYCVRIRHGEKNVEPVAPPSRTHERDSLMQDYAAALRAAGMSGRNGVNQPSVAADAAARLAEIPRDTRDLTARMFGDPLPGRRAIDMRGAA